MEKLSQKWAIIVPLEPVEDDVEFSFDEFPLHLTLAGVFAIDDDGQTLTEKLSDALAYQQQFAVTAEEEQWFGPDKSIGVMKITKTPELTMIYDRIYTFLQEAGAVFNAPQYEGAGFVPHATHQKHASLRPGDSATVGSVSIVDLFPGGNGYKRKIVRTIPLVSTSEK